ncbi:hypothetical protein QUC31_019528 [Theobroma cacao]
MRGSIGRSLSNTNNHYLTSITKGTSFLLQSSFSTSSSSGSGGGRGRGGASPSSSFIDFTPPPGKSGSRDLNRDSAESPPAGVGHGRGRGRPLSSDPIPHPFSSFVSQTGSGRGRVTSESVPPPPPPPAQAKQPIFIKKKDEDETESSAKAAAEPIQSSEPIFPPNILPVSVLSGAGRGKPVKQPEPASRRQEENRHIRVAQQQSPSAQMSQEEATKKAMGILSRRSESGESGMVGRGGRASMGMGGGRGRGRGMGRGRGRRQGEDTRIVKDSGEGSADGLYLGDNADGEKFAQTIGADNMNKLVEGFEEMGSRVLPSPMDDAYLDALHTNCSIEFEPEYLMEEFGTNPDIDEKPPMPLRDALEKMKPFLMAYEGIQSQEEWEEVIKETMERVPLLQEIVDYYSGPDRVTAKKQQEELERVAKTIPECAPSSVKQFANRAVLSLQHPPVMLLQDENAE